MDSASVSSEATGGNLANVVVAVRIRPLSSGEIAAGVKTCCQSVNDKVVAIKKHGDAMQYLKSQQLSINEYAYDFVFDEQSTQRQIFEKTAKAYINRLVEGQNVTVFAYGATGAGKTHTMLGNTRADAAASRADAGIIPNAVQELFSILQQRQQTIQYGEQYQVYLSFLEVYNEQVFDLLESSGRVLSVREDQEKGIVVVAGITETHVQAYDQVIDFIVQGNKRRKTEATMANAVSSRSHAVLQLVVKHTMRQDNGRETCVESKLSLIDLAGSERASATNNRGVRLQEGASINKSLLALANCINALAENSNGKKVTNVKYRDSKLTHLLKCSLEGNCNLIMIANINPSDVTYEDSHNTLKYANRAKNIKVNPMLAKEVSKESTWIEREARLRDENTMLKKKLQVMEEQMKVLEKFRNAVLLNGGVLPANYSDAMEFTMPTSLSSSSSSNLFLETSKLDEDINLSVSTLSASETETSMVVETLAEEVVVMTDAVEAVHQPVLEFEAEPFLEKEMVMLEEDFLPIRPSDEPDVNLANPRKRRISHLPTMTARRQSMSATAEVSKVKPSLDFAGVNKDSSSIPLRRSGRLSLSATITAATPANLIATAMSRLDKVSTPVVENEHEVASSSTKKPRRETSPRVPTPSALNDSADIDPTIIKLEDFENIDWLGEKEPVVKPNTTKVGIARRVSVGGNTTTRRKSLAQITSMLDNLTQEINSMAPAKKAFGFSVAATNVSTSSTNVMNTSTTSFAIHEDKDRRVTRSMANPTDEPAPTKISVNTRRKSIQPLAKDGKMVKASLNNENARNEDHSEHRWIDI